MATRNMLRYATGSGGARQFGRVWPCALTQPGRLKDSRRGQVRRRRTPPTVIPTPVRFDPEGVAEMRRGIGHGIRTSTTIMALCEPHQGRAVRWRRRPGAASSLFYTSRWPRSAPRVWSPFAPRGQQHVSPGHRPGSARSKTKKPCRGATNCCSMYLRTCSTCDSPTGNTPYPFCRQGAANASPWMLRPFRARALLCCDTQGVALG